MRIKIEVIRLRRKYMGCDYQMSEGEQPKRNEARSAEIRLNLE